MRNYKVICILWQNTYYNKKKEKHVPYCYSENISWLVYQKKNKIFAVLCNYLKKSYFCK